MRKREKITGKQAAFRLFIGGIIMVGIALAVIYGVGWFTLYLLSGLSSVFLWDWYIPLTSEAAFYTGITGNIIGLIVFYLKKTK
jgi:hypothetical protein